MTAYLWTSAKSSADHGDWEWEPVEEHLGVSFTNRRPPLVTKVDFATGVIRPQGEISFANASQIQTGIDMLTIVAPRPEVTVDLTKVSFIDVTGLRALLAAGARGRRSRCRLHLMAAPMVVRQMAQLLGTPLPESTNL